MGSDWITGPDFPLAVLIIVLVRSDRLKVCGTSAFARSLSCSVVVRRACLPFDFCHDQVS